MKKMLIARLLSSTGIPLAFDPGSPTWKMDGDKVAMREGNPVYLQADGSEMVIDFNTISRLNGEAKTHREAKEAATNRLKEFEGIDPKAAREAFEKLSKIDQKKLIDAGEVDKVTAQISGQFTTQLQEKDAALTGLQGKLNKMILDSAFSQSVFIRDNIAIPPDFFRDGFSKFFKVENEKIVALGHDGNPLYSQSRAGEPANFEEAIQILVDRHPAKNDLLRTNVNGGSGNQGNGGGRGAARTMRRADFEKLSGSQQAEVAMKARKGEVAIVD